MKTEIKRTRGEYVPTGKKVDTWRCNACGFRGTAGTWRAPDGEEGLWCYKCAEKGTKSALVTVQVDELRWVRGHVDVKCCGHWLRCDGFTNTCGACGADYNGSGQQLAPRSQWGEETGESLEEILSV